MKKCKLDKTFLLEVYHRLYRHLGPSHWWPAETPLEVAVGAILTQNVSWNNVEKAISHLKAKRLLEAEKLYRVSLEELEVLLKPVGFYRVKAKRLKAFIEHLCRFHGGSLENLFRIPLEEARRELLSISGIGPETADAILCYAGGYPIMVMDAYTRRVFHRLGCWSEKISYGEMQDCFLKALPVDVELYREFHALIDILAKSICKKKPLCSRCPLEDLCLQGKTEDHSPLTNRR